MINIFTDSKKYMFSKKFMSNLDIKKQQGGLNEKTYNPVAVTKPIENIFYPREKDTLFWILHIIEYDFFQYELDTKREFIKEKEGKIKLIEFIRTNKNVIKEHKWKISKLEEDLLSNKIISMSTFYCLCFLKKINIIIKNANVVYYKPYTEQGTNPNTIIIYDKSLKKYGIYDYDGPNNNNKTNELLDTCYVVKNINKPVEPINTYKITELRDICKKLHILICDEMGKKIKKQDLYKKIKSQLIVN
jgi:hypothetical protein